jgi:hypothetical protein
MTLAGAVLCCRSLVVTTMLVSAWGPRVLPASSARAVSPTLHPPAPVCRLSHLGLVPSDLGVGTTWRQSGWGRWGESGSKIPALPCSGLSSLGWLAVEHRGN